ncbi:MAG: hypothetical protein EOP06_04715 [Proteobacteria bacterium]|nr:MAG: hypothetical protein EOP06_04715 [Pseudomonadota bacterium]
MHHDFAKAFVYLTLFLSSLLYGRASFGEAISGAPAVVKAASIDDSSGLSGETEFVELNDTSSKLILEVEPKSQVVKSATRTDAAGTTTHSVGADGVERVVATQIMNGRLVKSEVIISAERSRLGLSSISSRPESKQLPNLPDVSKTRDSRDVKCTEEPIREAAYAIDEKAIAERFVAGKKIEECGEQTAEVSQLMSEINSERSKISGRFLTCARGFERYRSLIEVAEKKLSPSGSINFVCTKTENTSNEGPKISLGTKFLAESSRDNKRAIIFASAMQVAQIEENEIPNLTACCAGDANDNKSCTFQTWMGMKTVPITYGIRELLRESQAAGAKAEALDAFNDEAFKVMKKHQASNLPSDAKFKKAHQELRKLCGQKLPNKVCDAYTLEKAKLGGEMSLGKSSNPQPLQVAGVAANPSQPAQEGKPSKALPPVAQKITYQRNDQESLKRTMNRYQYMGPLASSVRKVAASVSAQLGNEAYAATTGAQDSGAGVGGGDAGFQSTPVKFDSAGNTISRINVNGKNVYVKASIPFSDTKIGEPSVSMGSSIGSMAPVPTGGASVAKQKFARGQSPAADSAGASGSGDFAPGVVKSSLAGNAGAATSPTSTPQRQVGGSSGFGVATGNARTVSSASPSYETVGKFNRALLEANDPRDFLRNAEPSLEQLKIQVVLNGARREMYPPKPTYRPTRIIDYNELKRAMRK